jgi:hypothetical protein
MGMTGGLRSPRFTVGIAVPVFVPARGVLLALLIINRIAPATELPNRSRLGRDCGRLG